MGRCTEWAVITGASSGIGTEFAKLYASRGYGIVLAARRTDRLLALAEELDTETRVIECDLSHSRQCTALYNKVSDLNVTLLINCAGFGAVGKFDEIDLSRQIEMTETNCIALMSLTHLFLADFKRRDSGKILNVASAAGLLPGGPNMAVYYATKAYVVSLTNAICEELREEDSNVTVSSLCPGPVDTEFNDVAGVRFSLKGITPKYCAKYAACGLDRGERVIMPERRIRMLNLITGLVPKKIMLYFTGRQQKKKL
jgi:hypothetical protein